MNMKCYGIILFSLIVLCSCVEGAKSVRSSVVVSGAEVRKLAGGFKFTEGPAADTKGNIFFTDIPNNRIHKWSLDGELSTFMENSGGANGLFFVRGGNLLACLGNKGQVVAIGPNGSVTILAAKYQGKLLNSPNDLWPDGKGRIYFSDPHYGRKDPLPQDGEHVYCLFVSSQQVIRIIDDMVRPNGLIGSSDGKTLYVADRGAGKTYAYTIKSDGTLSDKRLFAEEGSDGMTIDNKGNIYLTTEAVSVYDPNGNKIKTIEVPEVPSNVCFGGRDNRTLFITARTSLYSIDMRVAGQ